MSAPHPPHSLPTRWHSDLHGRDCSAGQQAVPRGHGPRAEVQLRDLQALGLKVHGLVPQNTMSSFWKQSES